MWEGKYNADASFHTCLYYVINIIICVKVITLMIIDTMLINIDNDADDNYGGN